MTVPNLTRVEWALRLAQLGYPLLKLKHGAKEPEAGHSWADSLTTDEITIREWFEDGDPNYGVCGGSDRVIIDIDVKENKDGDKALSQIEADQDFDSLISTTGFIVRSPSGGKHYYLVSPFPVANAHRFPKGIDVRGTRGYVVGPASELIAGCCKPTDTTGFYEVQSDEIPLKTPTWVVERLKRQGEKDKHKNEPVFDLDSPTAIQRGKSWIELRKPAIIGQEGDKHTLLTAMGLMDFGLSEEKTLEIMTSPIILQNDEFVSWNYTCEPPWNYNELATKVANAWRYREERPGVKGTGLMEMFEAEYGNKTVEEAKDEKWARLREHTFPGGTIFGRNKQRDMVIPDWLPGHGMVAILAKRGVGKSVCMLDMSLRLSLDMEWHGMPVRKGMYAIYICGEDDEGAEEQIRAWCIAHEKDNPPARFIFLDIITDLLSDDDVREWAEFLKDTIGVDSRAVTFVDTWQRATASGGQNKDEDMQKAVHYAEAIGRSLGGPIVIAAHPSKANEDLVLGSSVIENSTTAIWKLSEVTQGRKLEVTRIKGRGYGNYQIFKFVEQRVGQLDEFGRPRTGIYPVKIGGMEANKEQEITLDKERSAYAEIISAIDMDRLDPVYGDGEKKPYAVGKVAQKIMNLLEEAKEIDKDGMPTPRAKWATDMVNLLKNEANIQTWGARTIWNRLTELFGNMPQGQPMKNGFSLRLKQDGKAFRFYIEKNLIDREGKKEDDVPLEKEI